MGELVVELRGDDEVWISGPCDPQVYASICDPLVRDGRLAHFVEVAAGDALELDRWYGLSFGRQQVYATAELSPTAGVPGALVREATLDDVFPLTHLVRAHLQGPPVWSSVEIAEDEARATWSEWFNNDGTTAFVAELDGHVAAYAAFERQDEQTIALGVAATLPEARGHGLQRALWAHATTWALGEGYARCDTDWRATNLEADRCWTALGFRPTRYRLHRLVGR